MADVKNRQALVELEYCLDKYLTENYIPIVDKTYSDLQKKQVNEREKQLNSSSYLMAGAAGPDGGMSAQAANLNTVKYTGEWSRKNMDDLVNMCGKKITADKKIQQDLNELADVYRALFIEQIGVKKYKELSADGDLASNYIFGRIKDKFVERMSDKTMPRSTFEYILRRANDTSMFSILQTDNSVHKQLIDNLNEKRYNANGVTKKTGTLVGYAMDATMMGPTSIAAFAGEMGISIGFHVGNKAYNSIIAPHFEDNKKKDIKVNYDQELSLVLYGQRNVMPQIHKEAKKVNPQTSQVVRAVNQVLNRHLHVPEYHRSFSPYEAKQINSELTKLTAKTDNVSLSKEVKETFKNLKAPINTKGNPPAWMLKMSEAQCRTLALDFASKAIEMQKCGTKTLEINGKNFTYQQVAQRAYDYSAAAAKLSVNKQKEQAQVQSQPQTQTQQSYIPQNAYSAQSPQKMNFQQPQNAQQQMMQQQAAGMPTYQQLNPSLSTTGWEGLSGAFGLNGLGDLGKNLGYVFAMLPDMLVGMFTGKTRNLQFKDNLLPIGAILAGLFLGKRNPFLKFLLVGLGGASLLNKAGHEILENGGLSHGQTTKQYKRYDDEKLDPRLKDVGMKGNTMLVTIDGVPNVITISDAAVDAYYKGAVPLNTLANAVLRNYDLQKQDIGNSYERGISESEDRTRTVGIK